MKAGHKNDKDDDLEEEEASPLPTIQSSTEMSGEEEVVTMDGAGEGQKKGARPTNEKPSYLSYVAPLEQEEGTKGTNNKVAPPRPSYLSYAVERPEEEEEEGTKGTTNNNVASPSSSENPPYLSYAVDPFELPPRRPGGEQVLHEPNPHLPNHRPGAYSVPGGGGGGGGGIVRPNRDPDEEEQSTEHAREEQPPPEIEGLDNNGLAQALPVRETTSQQQQARPIDQDRLEQLHRAERQANDEKQTNKLVSCLLFFFVANLLVVIFSLTSGLRNNENQESTTTVFADREEATAPPTPSPTSRPLPPMMGKTLELLYDDLPPKTKESLYDRDSPQYQAWEWVLNHPNITIYPEWRKKQVFAMATFYYSFQGPYWPEEVPASKRWMDYALSECSWVLSKMESAYLAEQFARLFRDHDAYNLQDWFTCNSDGQLQTLLLFNIFVPIEFVPVMPPEIGLLSSIHILGILSGQIGGQFSDLIVVPELMELPALRQLTFYGADISGTIPSEIGSMTGSNGPLQHLMIGKNQKLTGSIPSEIAKITTLEIFASDNIPGLTGKLPTQLGLMNKLTSLNIFWNSITGKIPSQIGLLHELRWLALDKNRLTGTIPSQLGLLTANTWLALYENQLTGSLPTELGLMTSATRLRMWNNALTGPVPSELGLMTNMIDFKIGNDLELEGPNNDFTGTLPEGLWEFSHLKWLYLPNLPNIHGRVFPRGDDFVPPNLTVIRLEGSPHISGVIPEELCYLQEEMVGHDEFSSTMNTLDKGLDFDCNDLLCGCNCSCVGVGGGASATNNGTTDPDWF